MRRATESASGVSGKSHAATIVTLAAISGPFIVAPLGLRSPARANTPTQGRHDDQHAPARSVRDAGGDIDRMILRA